MRISSINRKTKETEIFIELNLDGTGDYEIKTPYKFFNHMLQQIASHSMIDMKINAISLDENSHHLIEDTAIALGECILKALGDKLGINRYGQFFIPMDEALSLCAIDLSGRCFSKVDAIIPQEKVDDFETALLPHFFTSLSQNLKANIHIKNMYGEDSHHIIESIFKAFAFSLKNAIKINPENKKIPSSKGIL